MCSVSRGRLGAQNRVAKTCPWSPLGSIFAHLFEKNHVMFHAVFDYFSGCLFYCVLVMLGAVLTCLFDVFVTFRKQRFCGKWHHACMPARFSGFGGFGNRIFLFFMVSGFWIGLGIVF
jgi:hypothetical protein